MKSIWIVFACLFLRTAFLPAQLQQQPGILPTQTYDESNFDTVDLVGGAVQLHIPIISYPQRGTLPPLGIEMVYNTPTWSSLSIPNNGGGNHVIWAFNAPITSGLVISPNYSGATFPDGEDNNHNPLQGSSIIDTSGATHQMFGVVSPAGVQTNAYETIDGSGLGVSPLGGFVDRNGIRYIEGCVLFPSSCTSRTSTYMLDPNGNSVTLSVPSGLIDSIGRSIPIFSNQFAIAVAAKCEAQQYPVAGGTTAPITICWQQFPATSAFGEQGVQEGTATFVAISSVTLQNGASWVFNYDSWGFLHSVLTPTGAVMTYAYYPPGSGYPADQGLGHRYLQSRTLNVNGATSEWSYAYSTVQAAGNVTNPQTIVTDPLGNTVTHIFDSAGPELQTLYKQGTQSLIKTVQHTFVTIGFQTLIPKQTITIYPNGQSSTTCVIYDNNTNTTCTGTDAFSPSGLKVYDPNDKLRGIPGFVPFSASLVLGTPMFSYTYDLTTGSGPGALLSETANTYQWQVNDNYRAANLLDLLSTSSVSAGGAPLSTTTHSYDEAAFGPTGVFGHATTEVDGGIVTTHAFYNTSGMTTGSQDGNGNLTTITYDATGAYPQVVTRPVTKGFDHISRFMYDANTGLMTAHTDETQQKTTYAYDTMRRPTNISYPDGGQETYSYNDVGPNPTITHTKKLTASTQSQTVVTADALGRQIQSEVSSDPEGPVFIDTTYDGIGNVRSTSNPHRSAPSASDGVTSYVYDALSRKTLQTQPDGSTLRWSYSGDQIISTDEAGHSWLRNYDPLGRIGNVTEPNGASTGYVYDAMGNLKIATQIGVAGETRRSHTFTYDSLSRLSTAFNPENKTRYGYDANNNLLAKQYAGLGIITYTYDALNRLTRKTYSDGITPTALFVYDTNQISFSAGKTFTTTNTLGRLSVICQDIPGACQSMTAYSYDAMGRATQTLNSTPSNPTTGDVYVASATYDLAGDMTSLNYPDGRVVTQSWNNAGQLQTATFDNWNGQHVGYPYVTAIQYTPSGAELGIVYGNNVGSGYHMNNRMQVDQLSFGGVTSKTSFGGKVYCFGPATPPLTSALPGCDAFANGNNGNVWQVKDLMNSADIQTFTYDSLNRLTGVSSPALNEHYVIDSFGNMSLNGSLAIDPLTNRFSNLPCAAVFTPYDAAGNQTCDVDANGAARQYTFDGENRVSQIAVMGSGGSPFETYFYGADGSRTRKANFNGSFTEYIQLAGLPIAERNSDGTWSDYIFANGRRIARSATAGNPTDGAGSTIYYHGDHLGSTQLLTNGAGSLLSYNDYSPYGKELAPVQTVSEYKFTGKERDAESGLDNFGARYYGSSMGRFMSPDWSASADPVPYARMDNPQSLNLYAYVGNNPLSRRDGDGHSPCGGSANITINVNSDGTSSMSQTPDCPDNSSWIMFAGLIGGGVGHHYIPQSISNGFNSMTQRLANNITSGPLVDKTKNYYDALHRVYNDRVRTIIQQYLRDTGKSMKELSASDIKAIVQKMKNAGGEIEEFNNRLNADENPALRDMDEALREGLKSVGENAAQAIEETVEECEAGAPCIPPL